MTKMTLRPVKEQTKAGISHKNLVRLLIVLLPLMGFAIAPARRLAQQNPPTALEKTIRPFLVENCLYCHNAKKASGGLNLEQFQTAASLTAERETWERILQRLQAGEMPPKGAPHPDDATVQAFIRLVEGEFERADKLVKPDPGRVTARRLNRAEYNNTVRDLLGVNFGPADDFPQDDSGYGFDNIGDVLSLSPVLMEKYLTAAEKIARIAVYGEEPLKPTLARFSQQGRPPIKTSMTPLFDYDETGLSLPNSVHVTHRFPAEGEYVFRILLGGNRPGSSEPMQLALWIDGQQVKTMDFDPEKLASFEIDRQELGGKVPEIRARVTAGEHWVAVTQLRMYEGLPARYNGPNPSKRTPPPVQEFKPRPGLPPERIEEFRKRFEERRREAERVPVNDARVSNVEIGGPYNQRPGPTPESYQKVFICGHAAGEHQPTCARKIVAQLARRAYRRPATQAEIGQLASLVTLAQRKGDSFEEGICLAIQATLVSPHFLFRIERDAQANATRTVTPHELAARLSYFLWSTMPDEELSRLADNGSLSKPTVLSAQVQRMLKDERARALVENFGGQWLELRKLESVKPDRQRFPQFDEYLRRSVQQETEAFFTHIVRADRSVLDFIAADYTFLNERLAQFYKIPGVKGVEFRQVALKPETQRGGILTQASVLTVSSYTTRTSPVLRGKWILENILNAPPPPPPPGVPTLDEEKVGSAASLRQQLEEHRKNPTCASCHSRMDPLGFGLENFDAIGSWRTMDGKFPIDATGTLPDGRTFKGPQELKTILLAGRDSFTEGLTEKLLTYGLGRGLERYDKPTVKQIAKRVAANDYRFSSLVLEIVNSLPFQMRRGLPAANGTDAGARRAE